MSIPVSQFIPPPCDNTLLLDFSLLVIISLFKIYIIRNTFFELLLCTVYNMS